VTALIFFPPQALHGEGKLSTGLPSKQGSDTRVRTQKKRWVFWGTPT